MLVKSGGNPGQGESSIFGIMPPRSGFTFMSWLAATSSVFPVMFQRIPSFPNAMRKGRMSGGLMFSIVTEPRVAAASPMKEPISM